MAGNVMGLHGEAGFGIVKQPKVAFTVEIDGKMRPVAIHLQDHVEFQFGDTKVKITVTSIDGKDRVKNVT